MKNFLAFTLLALLTMAQHCHGQDYIFRVLANEGTNKVRKAGSSSVIPLKTGSKLVNGDEILAAKGAYIGLVHRTGKTLELRTPGTHNIRELEGKISTGTAIVASRYMNFVMDKINEKGRVINGNDHRRNLNTTVVVERATASAAIKMMMKEINNANKVYGDRITIKWEGIQGTSAYLITVKNIFNQVLLIGETSSTKVSLDLTTEKLAKERFIIVSVQSRDDEELKSRDFGIQRILPAQEPEFTSQLTILKNELQEESSLNKIILASFFEENNLYLDALTLYEDAVNLSPEVEDYKAIYEEFILTNGLGN